MQTVHLGVRHEIAREKIKNHQTSHKSVPYLINNFIENFQLTTSVNI